LLLLLLLLLLHVTAAAGCCAQRDSAHYREAAFYQAWYCSSKALCCRLCNLISLQQILRLCWHGSRSLCIA
jgi:hypothetical protein